MGCGGDVRAAKSTYMTSVASRQQAHSDITFSYHPKSRECRKERIKHQCNGGQLCSWSTAREFAGYQEAA